VLIPLVPAVDIVTVPGARVHVKPVFGVTDTVNGTSPVKLPVPVTLIVVEPVVPVKLFWEAVMVKSALEPGFAFTLTGIVTPCDKVPLEPVTSILKLPGVVHCTDRATDPAPPTSVELNDPVIPDGNGVVVKCTVPVKPFNLATVIVEVAVSPCVHINELGLAFRLKFGNEVADTVTGIVTP
jgi:hypothetical protein